MQNLQFDNRLLRELPVDPTTTNHSRQVRGVCASRVLPRQVPRPQLVAYAADVAKRLGISEADCQSQAFVEVFSGNRLLDGMDPFATCYGGHQFGNWAGQLGDGRVINLGELVNAEGEHWTLQLKGAGPTPYSRTADGLAVLRSSVREFLCSEAMHHLGVASTRALSLVLSGEAVLRDMFYDGNVQQEPGAIVCRVAPSFTRFGHFQLFAAQGNKDLLQRFTAFCLRSDFPDLGAFESLSGDILGRFFHEVCLRTADLMVAWMRVGFVHGVMNTDNMSILGLTIDYGPYGWLDNFDPDWTPNTTDAQGRRYRFAHQPHIAHWNLAQLAQSLHPLFVKEGAKDMGHSVEALESGLDAFVQRFNSRWQQMMKAKLGLQSEHDDDDALVGDLLQLLPRAETDMTLFYRRLARFQMASTDDEMLSTDMQEAFYQPDNLSTSLRSDWQSWLRRYRLRLQWQQVGDAQREEAMNRVNPLYVLRNYLAQQAIDKAEEGDFSEIHRLQQVLRDPYRQQEGCERFAAKRPEWARHRAGCSMLSCSS